MVGFWTATKNNLVALISLVVAIVALTFNTERANRTEFQRNIRDASFTMLRELHQLQLLVDQAHYGWAVSERAMPVNPIAGWVQVNYMDDLSEVIPPPVPQAADKLHAIWEANVNRLGVHQHSSETQKAASLESNGAISQQIAATRQAINQVLRSLE